MCCRLKFMRCHKRMAVLRRGNSETRRRAGSQIRAKTSTKYDASIFRTVGLVFHGKGSMFSQTISTKYLHHITGGKTCILHSTSWSYGTNPEAHNRLISTDISSSIFRRQETLQLDDGMRSVFSNTRLEEGSLLYKD